jgi:hypothetical protein
MSDSIVGPENMAWAIRRFSRSMREAQLFERGDVCSNLKSVFFFESACLIHFDDISL